MTPVKTCTTCRFAVLAGYDTLFCEAPQNAMPSSRTCCGVPENEPCKPICPAEIAAARAMDPAAPVDALREITRQEVARLDRQAFDQLYEADSLLNLLALNAPPRAKDPAS